MYLKPCCIVFNISITSKNTEKIDEIQPLYDLVTINVISGWIKKLRGPYVTPGL